MYSTPDPVFWLVILNWRRQKQNITVQLKLCSVIDTFGKCFGDPGETTYICAFVHACMYVCVFILPGKNQTRL